MSEQTIVLSLISHTNVGKTTLTRTLLRRDVGEVRDAPHVTDESTRYTMWASGKEQLEIWDTPGFGNVAALLKRLAREGGALGWIMNEVVDRLINRPLYSSLEAARNVRREADVVLYLINAREHPEDAGYVDAELKLLDALGKPVVMIINQASTKGGSVQHSFEEQWHEHFSHHPCLKGTMLLDAFSRTWHQELRLVKMVHPLLPKPKQVALDHLRQQFILAQQNLFTVCTERAGETLAFALNQRIKRSDVEDEQVFAQLLKQLQERLDAYLELLVSRHGIEAEGQAQLQADIQQVTGLLQNPVSESRAGLLTGAVAGAGSGLMADILSGGLTLGGGALLGFLGGYLGGFSTARVLNMLGKGSTAAWKQDALMGLYKLLVSYYLLAALHGRGRGVLQAGEVAPFLSEKVEQNWSVLEEEALLLMKSPGDDPQEQSIWMANFVETFQSGVLTILKEIYPNLETLEPEADETLPNSQE